MAPSNEICRVLVDYIGYLYAEYHKNVDLGHVDLHTKVTFSMIEIRDITACVIDAIP